MPAQVDQAQLPGPLVARGAQLTDGLFPRLEPSQEAVGAHRPAVQVGVEQARLRGVQRRAAAAVRNYRKRPLMLLRPGYSLDISCIPPSLYSYRFKHDFHTSGNIGYVLDW